MPYQCGSRKCDFGHNEKVAIPRSEGVGLLNKRIELSSKGQHRNRFIIGNIKWTKTSAVTELIIASLFKYQLNCVIVRVSVECYTPAKLFLLKEFENWLNMTYYKFVVFLCFSFKCVYI